MSEAVSDAGSAMEEGSQKLSRKTGDVSQLLDDSKAGLTIMIIMICVVIYIYIYIYRERERGRDVYIYIYIYIIQY